MAQALLLALQLVTCMNEAQSVASVLILSTPSSTLHVMCLHALHTASALAQYSAAMDHQQRNTTVHTPSPLRSCVSCCTTACRWQDNATAWHHDTLQIRERYSLNGDPANFNRRDLRRGVCLHACMVPACMVLACVGLACMPANSPSASVARCVAWC